MTVVFRGNTGRLRTSMSFTVSGSIHALALAWVALAPALRVPGKPRSLYDQEIRPNENRIVWYNLRDRLPDITPGAAHKDARPPRARIRIPQSLVAEAKDDSRPPQAIWMPAAPEIAAARPLPLPNVVAVTPSRAVRPFVAPVEEAKAQPALPALPEVPQVAVEQTARLPFAAPNPRITRAFTPPPEARPAAQAPVLPDAPRVAAAQTAGLPFAAPTPRITRAFTPPPEARPVAQAPALPDAPRVAAAQQTAGLPFAAPTPRITRAFTPPPQVRPAAQAAALPDAPRIPTAAAPQAKLAIVGLNPANVRDFPRPPGSRQAGFSGGPQPRPAPGDGAAATSAAIVVPGLLARGEPERSPPTLVAGLAPTSPRNLADAARLGRAIPRPARSDPRAASVSTAPDPMLEGRIVYQVAIQMPNVTSYIGSWIVWFAEREPRPGAPVQMRAPVPLRKVDPKYIAAAVDERVEGKVRLAAVIRRDGSVDSIVLLRHVDVRLDRSAADALAKWQFEPALRDGVPVDVDAVFEVPFQLAPRPRR